MTAMTDSPRRWALRYTAHLGYEPPLLRPQFQATLGNDVSAHVHNAAMLGMSGVLYPWVLGRPPTEVRAVRDALRATGLVSSCVVTVPLEAFMEPIWTDRTRSGRERIERTISTAAAAASELGTGVLMVPLAEDPAEANRDVQLEAAAHNLRIAANVAADNGMVIGIEPMKSLPGLLVRSISEAVAVIEATDHKSAGIIFDTGHASDTDGDVESAFAMAFPYMVLLQIVDQPGRVEPTTDSLPLIRIAAAALRRGYRGLVDLEHGWKDLSIAGERNGVESIKSFDAAVQDR